MQESKFNVGDALSVAFEKLNQNLGFLFLVTLVVMAIMFFANFILQFMFMIFELWSEFVSEIVGIIFMIFFVVIFSGFSIYILIGYVSIIIKIIDGNKPEWKDLFNFDINLVIRIFLACLVLYLIFFAITFLAIFSIIILDLAGEEIMTEISAILLMSSLMILFIFLFVRLWFFIFFIIDQNAGAVESLILSWKATSGHTLKLVGLYLLTYLIYMAGIFCCCVGAFFTAPVAALAVTYAYRKLSGVEEEKPPEPLEVHY